MILHQHPRFMDVAMEIKRIRYKDDKRVKVHIAWWNLGQSGYAFPIGLEERSKCIPIAVWRQLQPKECTNYVLSSKELHEKIASRLPQP